jgi:hypothetical protein
VDLKLQHIHDDDQNWAIRLCMRVGEAEYVVAGSIQKPCEECGVALWYDPSQEIPEVPGVQMDGEVCLCFLCGAMHMQMEDEPIKWISTKEKDE